ncbi:K(+) transporting P-type ATPase subunit KdpA [Azospirillaceae bacterium]
MTLHGWFQIALFGVIVLSFARPVGGYMARLFAGERVFLTPILRPVESALYRLSRIDERSEQHWLTYTLAMLAFNFAGFALLYGILRFQEFLPLNPQHMQGMPWDLAFNTAVSFVTNTNWQGYGGESALGNFAQAVGLTVQNFVSAATGLGLALALIRGFARKSSQTVGNFWVDLVRSVLYVLLPLSIVATLALVWQGAPQTLESVVEATTLEGAKQSIPLGPVASQEAIKMLGTNGGGFFNANSAHPYENPTLFSSLFQTILIFVLGAALTNVFGRMVGDERQGWAIFAAMGLLWLVGVGVCYWAEAAGNPAFAALGIDQAAGPLQSGGNMEGKEVRFGIANSALFAVVTTDASCGAVNAMHDSFTPLGGLVPLVNILLGEIVFGGVGSGLYGMLLYVVVAMFVAGLMVGRTPEYVGKKLEAREVKLTVLALLCMPLVNLGFTAIAAAIPAGVAGVANGGPHGFSEIFYAYSSAANNNGSAFAGLSANTLWYNLTLAATMFVGRFMIIVPMMAIAGSLAAKKRLPPSSGSFPTTGGLFVGILLGVILIMGGLTYFPALSLGPVVEHLLMVRGATF